MKKFILFLFVFSAFALISQGQNDTNVVKPQPVKKNGCFKLASISLDLGSNDYRIMNHDDMGFGDSSNSLNKMHSGNMGSLLNNKGGNTLSKKELTMEIGLNPYSKKLGDYNKKQELLIGLYYSGSDIADINSMKYANTVGDTFSFNSVLYQTDTIARSEYSYRVAANVLGASVKYLFKTDPEKRFSLFTGVGINAAYAITAQIHERFTNDTAVVVNFYNTNPDINGFDNGSFLGGSEEKISRKAKSEIFASVFVPFGLNFRLCKTKEVWNQMNLFIQGRVGLETEIIVKGATHLNPYMGCSMGFRFNFK
jgi:hypothetical protein